MGQTPIISSPTARQIRASSARRWTGFFLLAAVLTQAGIAQVRRIVFEGSSHFSSNQLLDLCTLRIGAPYDRPALRQSMQAVVNAYREDGYAEAAVDSVHIVSDAGDGAVDLTVYLHEGPLAIVHSTRLTGLHSLSPAELEPVMESREGRPFVPATLERDLRRILDVYARRGFALATAEIRTLAMSDSTSRRDIDVEIGVDEGERIAIHELRIEGNTTTRGDVIAREARVHAGDVYDDELPVNVKRRLDRLGLFASVAEPQLTLDEQNRAGLLIRVTEGSYNTFDGVVGYMPSPRPGEGGYLVGLVDLRFRNLFGSGRRLGARWYRENRMTQEVEVRYLEPWVLSMPLNAGLGFFQRRQDSLYVQFRYDLGVDAVVSEALTLGASFNRSDVYPAEGYGRGVLHQSNTMTVGGSLRYDTRDNAVRPASGILYFTEYQTGRKESAGRVSMQRITMDLSLYLRLLVRQVVAAEIHARDVESSQLDPSDLFRLGGTRTIRGYREGQFTASRAAWTNLEYRFFTGARSYVYGFLDVGLIDRSAGTSTGRLTRAGYGAGLHIDSSVGLIGVNIGFGQGDTFSTAKLHLQLINEF